RGRPGRPAADRRGGRPAGAGARLRPGAGRPAGPGRARQQAPAARAPARRGPPRPGRRGGRVLRAPEIARGPGGLPEVLRTEGMSPDTQ
ncbi:hypothetical protein F7Q88_17460, partial [Castellaniella defragrans]